jgi:hypothetical protein
MKTLKVLLDFAVANDAKLEERTNAVLAGLYTTAAYTTPPVTKVNLQAGLTAFMNAKAAQEQGGSAATALKAAKREALIELLRTLAKYVEENCGNDLPTLLASGFRAAKTERTHTVLTAPVVSKVINGNSGELVGVAKPVANAHGYQARVTALGPDGAPGAAQIVYVGTNTRELKIKELTPGVRYQVQFRATGAGDSTGPWSDPLIHMCM